MFRKDNLKNLIIILVITGLLLFLIIHLISYYKIKNLISERAVAGVIVITLILIHRIIAIYKEKQLSKLVGNPLFRAKSTEVVEKNKSLFLNLKKENKKIKTQKVKEIKTKLKIKDLFSKKENKYFIEKLTAQITNILFTFLIAGILIYYKKLILYYGLIGIGLAMFFGIITAAYFTKNLKKLYVTLINRRDSKEFRIYRKGLNNGIIEKINKVLFFKNWIYTGKVSICVICDEEMNYHSVVFLFMQKYFLEVHKKQILNGLYESDDLIFFFEPVSQKLIEVANEYTGKCSYIDEKDKSHITAELAKHIQI